MTYLVMTRKPRLGELASWLGDAAAETVVITSAEPERTGPDAAEASFLAVERVGDYSAASTGSLAFDLARRHSVKRIASLNEVDVLRTAAVRQLLGLPGQDLTGAVAFRDKEVMKSLAAAHGVPVAAMRRARDLRHAAERAAEIGYPVVVKPVDGGGGVGVHRVADASGWTDVRHVPLRAEALLVEAEVDEQAFYVVDGLTLDGRVTAAVVLDMGRGALDYAQGARAVTGYSVPPGQVRAERVLAHAAQVLQALPPVPAETAFHLEVFETRDGELVLCEIACRAGGVGHAPTFQLVTGIDLDRASVRGQLGLPRDDAGDRRLHEAAFVGFPRQEGVLVEHPDALSHPAVVSYVQCLAVGTRSGPPGWAGDNAATIQLATTAYGDIESAMHAAMDEYRRGTVWR